MVLAVGVPGIALVYSICVRKRKSLHEMPWDGEELVEENELFPLKRGNAVQ